MVTADSGKGIRSILGRQSLSSSLNLPPYPELLKVRPGLPKMNTRIAGIGFCSPDAPWVTSQQY